MDWQKQVDIQVSTIARTTRAIARFPAVEDEQIWLVEDWLILPLALSSPWVIVGIHPNAQAGLIGNLFQNQQVDGVGLVNVSRQRITDGLQILPMERVTPYQLAYLPFDKSQAYTLSLWTTQPEEEPDMSTPPPPTWTEPNLLNGWVDKGVGYHAVSYWKDSLGIVHLRGVLVDGAESAALFMLPTGYRPGAISVFVVPAGTSTGIAYCEIHPDGTVLGVGNTSTYFGVDGITFRAEG